MCGIAGAFGTRGAEPSLEYVRAMVETLVHRGPNASGFFQEGPVTMGMRRLSVIDVETGNQPIYSADGSLVIVYNGEVYNYVELRRELMAQGHVFQTTSDTEVVLALYAKEGPECLKRLNGMFAFAVYDRNKRSLFVVRDRLGKKPLFYTMTNGMFLFGSELKALLRVDRVKRRLNKSALNSLLAFNYVPSPETMFEGVFRLPAGCWMEVSDEGRVRIERYWQLPTEVHQPKSMADVIADIQELFVESTRIRLRSDVPLGAFLSGGIDSSTVVAIMSEQLTQPVRTFSMGFEDDAYSELPYAAQVATQFGTRHRAEVVKHDVVETLPKVLWHLDQPHGDVSFMPTLRVSELAVQDVTVVLTGDGGDEVFGGYEKYTQFLASNPQPGPASERAYFEATSVFTTEERTALLRPTAKVDSDPFTIFQAAIEGVPEHDLVNRLLAADLTLLLEGNNLVKPDRMAMAVSLEPRSPFLDVRLVEYVAKLPGSLKVRDHVTKVLMKQVVTKWLPDSIIHRKKQMFTVPIGDWFRGELRGFITELLTQPRTLERGLFDQDVVNRMLQLHLSGQANFTRQLRLLMVIELWHRMFLDDLFATPPSLHELGVSAAATY